MSRTLTPRRKSAETVEQHHEESPRADLWLFGLHAVESVLRNDPENIIRLMCAEGRRDQRLQHVETLAHEVGVKIQRVEMRELDKLTRVDRHQGVAAQYRPPRSYDENDLYALLDRLDEPALLLVLDGVTDPHNLGACLRVADGAGVHAVIAPKDRAASLTPTARNVACGAADSLHFVQVKTSREEENGFAARGNQSLIDIGGNAAGACEDAQGGGFEDGKIAVASAYAQNRADVQWITIIGNGAAILHSPNLKSVGSVDEGFCFEITGAMTQHRQGLIYTYNQRVAGAPGEPLHFNFNIAGKQTLWGKIVRQVVVVAGVGFAVGG